SRPRCETPERFSVMGFKEDWKDYYTVGELKALIQSLPDGMPILIKKHNPQGNKKFDASIGADVHTVKLWDEGANAVVECDSLVIHPPK
ncbi:MAG: hypothetical protein MN733_13375, partial [Nitrososphaera sp.]|nr:hypothetical protein [Nitrososphaera sp.]